MEHIEPPPIRRRTDIDIIVQMLDHLMHSPSRKTPLMNDCRLSHKVLVNYIDKLIKSGYVIERPLTEKKGYFYAITEAGNQFLLKLQESLALVQEVLEVEEALKG